MFGQGRPEVLWQGREHSDRVNSVIVSPDRTTIISGSSDRLIHLWRASDGLLLRTLNSEKEKIHENSVESLALSPDGIWLAAATFGRVDIWQLPEGSLVRSLTAQSNWVVSVNFSPDGQFLASGSFDTTVCLWRVSDWSLAHTLTGHVGVVRPVAFSPDGTLLASGSGDTTIRLWQVSDGSLVRTLFGHTADVESLAFSPDGRTLASGSEDTLIHLWDVADGTAIRTMAGHGYFVYALAYAPDGLSLASAGGEDNTLRLWRPADGILSRTFTMETDGVNSLAFVASNAVAYGRTDGSVILARLPPVSISSLAAESDSVDVHIDGELGRSFVLEASGDLLNWSSVLTNSLSSETFLYSEPKQPRSRFFRLKY